MGGPFLSPAWGVACRNLRTVFRTPFLLLPPLLAPIVFLVAFAGGLSTIGRATEFEFPGGYTAFQFVWVLFQAALITGLSSGLTLARDFQRGFSRRLLLAIPDRRAVLVGYVISALGRLVPATVILLAIGLLLGMEVGGGPGGAAGLAMLALLVCAMGALWASGVALRVRSLQAAPLMQLPVFIVLFVAPVFVPIEMLDGWIHGAAVINPCTYLLEGGRALIAGRPESMITSFTVAVVTLAVLTVWALRGLRLAERSG